MFDKKRVLALFIPVLIENASVSLLGIVSGVMVSSVGEFAMSAVSTVETLNVVVMNLFVAVATGVTVKVSQFIGQKRPVDARRAAEQSIMLSVALAAFLALVIVLFGKQILGFLFGGAEEKILSAAGTYLVAVAVSYPFYALYTTCNGIMRGAGDFKIILFNAILINALNAALGALFIFVFHLGVLGTGLGLILCRAICGALNYFFVRRGTNMIRIGSALQKPDWPVLKSIMRIGAPAGLDSVVFNGGRLLVQTFIVSMGSVAIAANAVGNNLSNFLLIPGNAINAMAVTIIGQTFGAGDLKLCRRYMWYILAGCSALMLITCGVAAVCLTPLIGMYQPSAETAALSRKLLYVVIVGYPVLWSLSFVTPTLLRATGDVKYTTIVSISSMWIVRVFAAWVLGVYFKLGVLGVWYAMVGDWLVRSAFDVPRMMSKRWERLDRI